MRIMIDPGHYGWDSGAVGPAGTYERDITMAVARQVVTLLQQAGQDVRLAREPGQLKVVDSLNNDLYTRVVQANQWPADIFVSIHCNAFTDPSAHGMEVYTTPGQGPSDQLATAVIEEMAAEFPELTLRADQSDGDRDKESNFYVIRKTSMPAILVEMAFISNPTEEQLLVSPSGQYRFAQAIARGILKYIGVPTATPPVRIKAGGQVWEATIIDGRSHTQVRQLAEALGHKVTWDEATKTVIVE